jgi:UDP-N-acetylglucosamine 2-epimerase
VPETEKEAKVVVDAHNKENVRKNIEQMKKDMNEVINNSKNKP